MATGHLLFLYDPLCGWCYGSLPALATVAQTEWIVEPLPTGLFAGDPAKRIDATFAQHIAQADARIADISGQTFSEAYQRDVLGNADLAFDSGPATQALTAVARWNPTLELQALQGLQRARFVDGRDITRPEVIVDALVVALGDGADDWHARLADPKLPADSQLRVNRARQLMHSANVHGVPTLLWASSDGLRLLPGHWLFSGKPLAESLATLH